MLDTLKTHNKIIINTDLDGILTGLILQTYANCEVVGFCNSADKIWLGQNQKVNANNVAFIDMFVCNANIVCIDQHVVAYNQEHLNLLKENKNKFNPNILRDKCFYPKDYYYSKYPFGTVHFVLATLEKLGLDLSEIKLLDDAKTIQPIDYFLRADDTLLTSVCHYQKNALDWWKWLKVYSGEGKVTKAFYDYVYACGNAKENKKNVEHTLKASPFYCDKPDGGYKEILTQRTTLKDNFLQYVVYIAKIIGLPPLVLSSNYSKAEGIPKRINFRESNYLEFIKENKIENEKVFSYAFVKSYGKEDSFSYTCFP